MKVALGPLLRENAHTHRCRAWIDGRAAGELVRSGPTPTVRWQATGPVEAIFPTMGRTGGRKPEVLLGLQSMLDMLGPSRRGALAAYVDAYDRGDGR